MTTQENSANEEKFIQCKNCDKKIAANKWILHENFCIQHVKKCEICNEVINREEEEEHIQDYHSKRKCEICGDEFQGEEFYTHKQTCLNKITCKFCNKEHPPKEIDAHILVCDKNLFLCNFCFSEFPTKDKKDHEYFCGSKTEKCSACNKFIRLKDMNSHISFECFPEEVPIHQQVNVDNIQIKNKRKSSGKPGVIASLNQMGILHKVDTKAKVNNNNKNHDKNNNLENKESASEQANSNSKVNIKEESLYALHSNILKENYQKHPIAKKYEDINNNQIAIGSRNDMNKHKADTKNRNILNTSNNKLSTARTNSIQKKPITPVKNNKVIKNNNDTNNPHSNVVTNELSKPNMLKEDKHYSNIKRLKEIENNLASLNNLGKNFMNSSNSNTVDNNNIKIAANKKNLGIKDKTSVTSQANNNAKQQEKNRLNMNYGIFEEKKIEQSEEPKFNYFYEKHDSPYNFNLNDEDYNKANDKNKIDDNFFINYYEKHKNDKAPINASNPHPNGQVNKIHANTNNASHNNNILNKNLNNASDKDYKKKIAEIIKTGKSTGLPVTSTIKENKNDDRVVKNIPYTKHYDINAPVAVPQQSKEQNKNPNHDIKPNSIQKNKIPIKQEETKTSKNIIHSNKDLSKNYEKNSKKESTIQNKANDNLYSNNTKDKKAKMQNPKYDDINSILNVGVSSKGPKKAQEINAKNFNYDEYQEDFLHDESLATGDFLKIMNKKKDLTNDNKKIEDEILNHVIMESLKHK